MPIEKAHPSFEDSGRLLSLSSYFSLYLFGLFNPVVKSMRGLCSVSRLARVQQEVCSRAVSRSSFSEAQHLANPLYLEKVFSDLASQMPRAPRKSPLEGWQWLARDGSLFRALPRMSWALYGAGNAGSPNRAVRLHLSFNILEENPQQIAVRPGKICERAVLREELKAGQAYVGDRYFGEDYKLFAELEKKGCAYVIRLLTAAIINVEEELPLSPEDRKAGVVRQAWARLGSTPRYRSVRLRVVWIQSEGRELTLVTNLAPEKVPAELIAQLYRWRWKVEMFFRWLKSLLNSRHWLAESPQGVTIQMYLLMIAALLLQLHTGRRPNKRSIEFIQFYLMDWATVEELVQMLQKEQEQITRSKIKKHL